MSEHEHEQPQEIRQGDVALGQLEMMIAELGAINARLARFDDPDLFAGRVQWAAGDSVDQDVRGNARAFLILNDSGGPIDVAFQADVLQPGRRSFTLNDDRWIVLPISSSVISVGGAGAGSAFIAAWRAALPPAGGNL